MLILGGFLAIYLYLGWIQPFRNFGKKSFSWRRKMVEKLKEID